jgi:uncharacterized protein (UPF0332 family)
MTDFNGTFLAKANESIEGAKVELAGGRFNNAANRSYYAVFQAAIHALKLDGVRLPGGGAEWGHAFVEAQFVGLLINRRHRYDTNLREVIRENRKLREDADYTMTSVNAVRTSRAVQRAERLLGAVVRTQEAQA